MATWQDLKSYLRVNASSTADDTFIQACFTEAAALVAAYNKVWDSTTSTYVASAAPVAIVDKATLECGSRLFNLRNAPNGVAQFADFDGAPIRVSRDVMISAKALLEPWLVVGF